MSTTDIVDNDNQPFRLRPFFRQRGLEYVLSEHLRASRSDFTTLVVV